MGDTPCAETPDVRDIIAYPSGTGRLQYITHSGSSFGSFIGSGQVIRIICPSIDLRQLVTGGFGYILGETGTAVRRSASESEAVSTAKRWLATGQNWLGQTPK